MKHHTKKILLLFALIDFCLILLFIGMILGTRTMITDATDKTLQVANETERSSAFSLMQGDITSGEQYERQLDQYVVGQHDTTGFVQTLAALASHSDVTFTIDATSSVSSANLSAIGATSEHVAISVDGSWSHVLFFLQLLEQYPLDMSFSDISINRVSPMTQSRKTPTWSANVNIAVVQLTNH